MFKKRLFLIEQSVLLCVIAVIAVTGVVTASDKTVATKQMMVYEKIHDAVDDNINVERAYYYDKLGRIVQVVEKNHLGGISRTSYKYKFSGDIEIQHESHQSSPTATADTKKSTFDYDNRGRLKSETTIVNNASTSQVTVNYSYDKLGQLTGKSFGNGITETYAYNIQGWLTTKTVIDSDSTIFSSTLRYYDTTKTAINARYNGDISEWEWQHGVSSANKQTYGYTYDGLNRLTNSVRYVGSSTTANNAYTEQDITYDRNGNIKTLKRYGTTSSTYVNNLNTASYTGNKLTSIKDGTTTYTYAYDNNGNMTTDGRRGINIGYNLLNLPKEVKNGSQTLGTYTYLADGTKTAVSGSTEELDYLGSLIYKKTGNTRTLENIIFSEGVINKSGTTYDRMYHIRDHLGSVRVVTDNSGANIEQNDYYPFGMRIDTGSQTSNRYKFSGKEEQTMVTSTFNYLDFGARHYDPVIVRWTGQDSMSEKYYGIGQYAYVANNPLRFVDPTGMDWYSYEEEYEDEDGIIRTKTKYKYTTEYQSQKELNDAGIEGTYLGKTKSIGDTYLSLGGAELQMDRTRISSIYNVSKIMQADQSAIMAVNAIEGIGNFWSKYDNLISSGSDYATVLANFMDLSKNLKGSIGGISIALTSLKLGADIMSYQKGNLKGVALMDAAVNLISLAGTPGSVISLGYTGAKEGAKAIVKFENFLQKYYWNKITNPFGY